MMLSKQEIIEQIKQARKEFDVCVSKRIEDGLGVIRVEFYDTDDEVDDDFIGKIRLVQDGDDCYEVEQSEIIESQRGKGKLLYYLAMNAVYPKFIAPDRTGCSIYAAALYMAFDRLDYVERFPIEGEENFMSEEELDGDVIIDFMYRFTLK